MEERDFGWALQCLKSGKKVCRAGWNGKDQWVCMMSGLKLPPNNSTEPGPKVNDRTAAFIGADQPLDSQPYLVLKNQQGKWQPGWVPSQGDLFATDWQIAE